MDIIISRISGGISTLKVEKSTTIEQLRLMIYNLETRYTPFEIPVKQELSCYMRNSPTILGGMQKDTNRVDSWILKNNELKTIGEYGVQEEATILVREFINVPNGIIVCGNCSLSQAIYTCGVVKGRSKPSCGKYLCSTCLKTIHDGDLIKHLDTAVLKINYSVINPGHVNRTLLDSLRRDFRMMKRLMKDVELVNKYFRGLNQRYQEFKIEKETLLDIDPKMKLDEHAMRYKDLDQNLNSIRTILPKSTDLIEKLDGVKEALLYFENVRRN